MEPILKGTQPVKPNLKTLDRLQSFVPKYDARRDAFFLRPREARPATSVDCDGELWLRVDIHTGEIVGLEIADFTAVFLQQHPELRLAWKDSDHRSSGRQPDKTSQSFLDVLVPFLRSFLARCSRQQVTEMLPA